MDAIKPNPLGTNLNRTHLTPTILVKIIMKQIKLKIKKDGHKRNLTLGVNLKVKMKTKTLSSKKKTKLKTSNQKTQPKPGETKLRTQMKPTKIKT